MIPLFSLGPIWVSDFLKDGEQPRGQHHELELVMEEDTRAVRLKTTVPLDTMFGKYYYRSGLNESMVRELKDIVDSILPLMKWQVGDVFLDIACNDGTLLSYVPDTFLKIGIDPADDSYTIESRKHAHVIVQDFFSAEKYKKVSHKRAMCVTAIAMFYDIENQDEFLQDVNEVMDDEGLLVMQLSHSGLMMDQCAFDNILSEHCYYLTLTSLSNILERNGLCIVDCQLNDTNGGSFRVYIRKVDANEKLFSTAPNRDVCSYRVNSLLQYEKIRAFDSEWAWEQFFNRINILRDEVVSFIKDVRSSGYSVWAIGASTKGNTLLQYFGLDYTMIDGISERSEKKWGLKTVGTNIPIFSEEECRAAKPDYVLILCWHFISSIMEREKDMLAAGTKFIVPMPQFQIIGND